MEFRNYGKIHRLGREETDGILVGTVSVQEKVDGANTSIWLDESGELCMGSRTRKLGEEEFNGFVPYVRNHEGIKELLKLNPNFRLYGEWLVRHTIAYKETAYKKFYLFDVYVEDVPGGEPVPPEERWKTAGDVAMLGKAFGIQTVPMHGDFENPTVEQLMEFVGKTEIGEKGEGIVLKNLGFINGFGENVFAKIVTQEFKEDNAVTFGGNNKFSDTYHEMWVVNKFMTLPRIEKIMHKLQPEVNERLDMKHIPRIINTAYHDMLTEEIWEIQKNVPKLDFKALQRCATKKAKQIYVDILNDSISIADRKN